MSTATFYPTSYGATHAIHTYEGTLGLINYGINVETTQMCLLNDVKDYDLIRIVNSEDDVIEIRNNHDGIYECERTDKELRYVHNLFKVWESGVLDR